MVVFLNLYIFPQSMKITVVKVISPLLQISFYILVCLFSTTKISLAQVTSDGTVNTQVTQNGNVSEITGGETRGGNLFHSFQDFSVGTGNEAFFNNATDISNILSRVTGGNISNIDGLIRANGSANLFLINPAGILFGENARLDIGGSFYGSSASSILFEDGEFSAVDLDNPPVLTINAPIGLNLRDQPGDIVNRSTAGLEVLPGQTIGLIGGDINFEGGVVFAPGGKVQLGGLAEAGTVGISDNGNVSFPENIARAYVNLTDTSFVIVSSNGDAGEIKINTGSLTVNNETLLAAFGDVEKNRQGKGGNVTINATEDVSFVNGSNIFVTGAQGGSIQLDAKNLSITSGSNFIAGIPSDSGFAEAQSGNININLAEDLILDGLNSEKLTFIANNSFGIGNPGNIDINARNITFQNGGTITNTSDLQQGGSIGEITLNARGDILFDGITPNSSGITNRIGEEASGGIGAINVKAQNLTITNGARIQSQVSGSADSGDINIDVADSIKVDGFGNTSVEDRPTVLPSGISSDIGLTGTGNAGKININTQNLEVSRNGSISGVNAGQGNGGDININAEQIDIGQQGNANISPSSINTQKFTGSEGNGGNITINTGSLSVNDGTEINANVSGQGNGGNIKINARDTVSVDGTGLFLGLDSLSAVAVDAFDSVGDAGNIEIKTSKLSVTNGGYISATILGDSTQGNGGDITIRASDSINVSGNGGIEADVFAENSTGNGGNLNIETGVLTIADGAMISADILADGSTGNGGDITIRASDSVNVSSTNGSISADVFAENSTGSGGNLAIETGRLTVGDAAQISAASFGNGNAGSLTINAESIELRGFTETGRGGIFAVALRGNGNAGDINIVTKDLTIADGASISASNFPSSENSTVPAGTGQPGNINIEANSIRLENGGRIVAATQSTIGEGANINLQVADVITLEGDSFISAQAFGEANGGNLKIDSQFIVAFPDGNNDIIANAAAGRGGNINITAESVFGIEEGALNNLTNDINASSEVSGLDGTVNITTPDLNPVQGATELPSNVIEAEQTTDQACQANREAAAKNNLIINGKGGIPPTPDLPLTSQNIIVIGQYTDDTYITPQPQSVKTSQVPLTSQNMIAIGQYTDDTYTTPEPVKTSQGMIQPARGIKITEDGGVILTAYPTNNAGERLLEGRVNCGQI
jgi:filamentous hemagglutinin family protein